MSLVDTITGAGIALAGAFGLQWLKDRKDSRATKVDRMFAIHTRLTDYFTSALGHLEERTRHGASGPGEGSTLRRTLHLADAQVKTVNDAEFRRLAGEVLKAMNPLLQTALMDDVSNVDRTELDGQLKAVRSSLTALAERIGEVAR